ncbi:glycosyl hydrolase [Aspergillus carlsbadensis]|nr:glycosyl hydrolase [Aspergillus carlsbadensis]
MTQAVNPIIPGFAPDPSLVKVGEWYFLVTSSFHMFPGLPIYVSKDLGSWKQIGNVINRRTQLSLAHSDTRLMPLSNPDEFLLAAGGLYAPTIRYHAGTFYVVCTNVMHLSDGKSSFGNFIATTSRGGIWSDDWSDPIYFNFHGIDPSLFIADDGRAYIQGSAAPGPWTTINMFEVDLKSGAKLSEERIIWRGTGGIYPEGPHLYQKDGWFYLLISEGGTHDGHMLTMARSREIWGPYEACPRNPILTAFGTGEYIQCTGHCDVFQDEEERWWGVCLGIRRGERGRAIMGRESFLTRGDWGGEWLSLENVKSQVQGIPQGQGRLNAERGVDFLYIRDAVLENYQVDSETSISLAARPIDFSDPEKSPTFVGRRQRSLTGKSSVVIPHFTQYSGHGNLKVGLACYKDEHRYVRIYYASDGDRIVFEIVNKAQKIARTESHAVEGATNMNALGLRIEYTENEYRLMCTYEEGHQANWQCLATVGTLDMTDPDFTGPVMGIFAVAAAAVDVQFEELHID